jgi:nitroreductase
MELMNAIVSRHSIRKYKPDQITEEELDLILKAGCAAPIGKGKYENLHITVIQNPGLLKKISQRAAILRGTPNFDTLYGAPTIVIISAKPYVNSQHAEYANAGCIIENMLLAATDLNIGSVYLWSATVAIQFDTEIFECLDLPDSFNSFGLLGKVSE